MFACVKPLSSYRGVIVGSIRCELPLKCRNSLLGAVWTLLHPAAMVVVHAPVFTPNMKARLPALDSTSVYSIDLCAGIFTPGPFAEVATLARTMFFDRPNLQKKIAFPSTSLPLVNIGNAIINFATRAGLIAIFLSATDNFPGLPLLAPIPLVFLAALFAIGPGLVVGIMHVFFRDIGQAFGVVMTFWCWLMLVIYPHDIISESTRGAVAMNPCHHGQQLREVAPGERLAVHFDENADVGVGSHSVADATHEDHSHIGRNFACRDHALVFVAVNVGRPAFVGVAGLPTTIGCAR